MPYDAILFDFDGVLADTEPLHCACWDEVLRPFGLSLSWDTFERQFIGVSDHELIEVFARQLAAARDFASIDAISDASPATIALGSASQLGAGNSPAPRNPEQKAAPAGFNPEEIQAFAEIWNTYPRKKDLFRQRVVASPPILPETVDLIRSLRPKYKLAVVSSSARVEIQPPLELTEIRDCFQELVCGREAGRMKPAPDPYLKAAQLLSAKQALAVEDSEAGVASARAAGLDVVQVENVRTVSAQLRAALAGPTR